MSFIGVVGVVAQAGQAAGGGGGGSAPTGVSIATSSSGNYDNALFTADEVYDNEPNAPVVHIFTPSASFNLASGVRVGSIDGDIDDFLGFVGISAGSDIILKAYCRATNATSFQWTVSVHSDTSLTNGTASVLTAGGTSQDSTGSNGAGKVRMLWGGSKAGFLFPEDGDTLAIKLECNTTNSNGSTAATPIVFKFKYHS